MGIVWFFGNTDVPIRPNEINRVDDVAYRVVLPDRSRVSASERGFLVLEDEALVGPELDQPWKVRQQGNGTFFKRRFDSLPGRPSATEVFFSATDNSDPRRSGRSYELRARTRTDPAAWFVLLGTPILALLTLRALRGHRPTDAARPAPRQGARRRIDLRKLAATFAVLVFTMFMYQAPNMQLRVATPWLLLVLAAVAPLLVLRRRLERLDAWSWWVVGLLAWSAATVFMSGGRLASTATLVAAALGCAWGLAVLVALRDARFDTTAVGSNPLFWITLVTALCMLLRIVYLDVGGWLGHFEVAALFKRDVWVWKLGAHWLLVLAWSHVIVTASLPGGRGTTKTIVLLVVAFVVALGVTNTAIVALVLSVLVAALAQIRPRLVRRVIGGGAALLVLSAPLTYRLPFWLHQRLAAGNRDFGLPELALRGSVWKHTCELIATSPLVGLGFGATGRLPRGPLASRELLSGIESQTSALLGNALALPGGHPHSLPLLTWLDLGFVGAALLTGLVLIVIRSIGSWEGNRDVHAGMLALFTVTAVFWVLNYDAWNPTLLALLFMTAALGGSVDSVPKTQDGGFRLVAMVIVLTGVVALAWVRLDRWLYVERLREHAVVLDAGADRLNLGGKELRMMEDSSVRGTINRIESRAGDQNVLIGWAQDALSKGKPAVHVFVGSSLVGVAWAELPSLEALRNSPVKSARSLLSGFEVELPPELSSAESPITLIIINERGTFRVPGPSLTHLQRRVWSVAEKAP